MKSRYFLHHKNEVVSLVKVLNIPNRREKKYYSGHQRVSLWTVWHMQTFFGKKTPNFFQNTKLCYNPVHITTFRKGKYQRLSHYFHHFLFWVRLIRNFVGGSNFFVIPQFYIREDNHQEISREGKYQKVNRLLPKNFQILRFPGIAWRTKDDYPRKKKADQNSPKKHNTKGCPPQTFRLMVPSWFAFKQGQYPKNCEHSDFGQYCILHDTHRSAYSINWISAFLRISAPSQLRKKLPPPPKKKIHWKKYTDKNLTFILFFHDFC